MIFAMGGSALGTQGYLSRWGSILIFEPFNYQGTKEQFLTASILFPYIL